MDIKRVNPGIPADNTQETKSTSGTNRERFGLDKSGKSDGPAAPASSTNGLLDPSVKRSDLTSNRWNEILKASIDKLLDRNSAAFGALPAGAREQVANMLASDPFFAKRVFLHLDQEASAVEGR